MDQYQYAVHVCSNRTFMELKFSCKEHLIACLFVLIVPLWNWNNCIAEQSTRYVSSNRTFMELKYVNAANEAKEVAEF